MYFLIFLNFFDPLCKNWPLPHNRTLLENQIFQNTRFFSKIFDPLILEETVYVTLFLSEILMTQESCSLIRQDTQLAAPKQN